MKKEIINIYSNTLEKEIKKEFDIYSRDELIKHIQDNNINLNEYALEVYAPCGLKCTIANLEKMNVDDKFFIFEEDKEMHLYLS